MRPTAAATAALLFDLLIVFSAAVLIVAAIAGGISIPLGLTTLTIHQPLRPALVLAALLAGRHLLRQRHWLPLREPLPYLPLLILCATAIGYSFVYLTMICGGADSYGYVSAALLIRHGSLSVPQPDASWLPAPNALSVLTPLGYQPRALDHSIVPLYPLGFPALIALASLIFPTAIAPYVVTPIAGVVALWLTWQITRQVTSDRAAAWLGAALVAWDPLVMTYAKQPMSDLPATVFFLAALWCLLRDKPAPLGAGLAAAASFLIRPGGVGAIAALGLLAWLKPSRESGTKGASVGERLRSATWFAAGVVPGFAVQALIQWRLFGSPFRTGYGSLQELYAGASLADNARIYGQALLQTHVPLWLPLVLASFVDKRVRPFAVWGVVLLALSITPYLLYFRFDHWETLRFVLPAVAVLDMAAAAATAALLARAGRWWRDAGTVVLAALAALYAGIFLQREGVPLLMEQEQRYTLTAAWIDQYTPRDALVIAGQHSGSIRHYAARTTVRWDLLASADLDPVVRAARERGRAVFAALDGPEQSAFRTRFANTLAEGTRDGGVRLLPGAQVRDVQIWEVVPARGAER